jgi:hypothetical protein
MGRKLIQGFSPLGVVFWSKEQNGKWNTFRTIKNFLKIAYVKLDLRSSLGASSYTLWISNFLFFFLSHVSQDNQNEIMTMSFWFHDEGKLRCRWLRCRPERCESVNAITKRWHNYGRHVLIFSYPSDTSLERGVIKWCSNFHYGSIFSHGGPNVLSHVKRKFFVCQEMKIGKEEISS